MPDIVITSPVDAFTEVAPNVFVYEGAFELLRARLPLRMTVIRTSDVGLVVFNPFPPDRIPLSHLDSLGEVKYVVAPNKFHHLWAQAFLDRYKDKGAVLLNSPGLPKKFPDRKWGISIDESEKGLLGKEFDYCFMEGGDCMDEIIFLHHPTSTLLITDLAFNFQAGDARSWMRLYLWLARGYTPCCLTSPFKFFFNNPSALLSSFDTVLEWDFDRIVMAHGHIVESGGKEALKAGTYKFLEEIVEWKKLGNRPLYVGLAWCAGFAVVAGASLLWLKKRK